VEPAGTILCGRLSSFTTPQQTNFNQSAISNSVAEMFTMQRFLQMTTLKAQSIAHFDS
jgi:hypothetical protein